jgi:hypothetical protein
MSSKEIKAEVLPGTRRLIDGIERVYYDGYWVMTYPVPEDTLTQKTALIEALTRRLFNHTEYGLDVPGHRLEEAMAAYQAETDPARKRVKGAMYAGAMFNRATDIFRHLVELQRSGVEIRSSGDLMRECGRCLQTAYELCRLVLHRSGEEGIDELWGEPFRAFSVPLDEFYEARYIKIAQSMRDIDRIADAMIEALGQTAMFSGIGPLVRRYAAAARVKAESLRTDKNAFDVWAEFVTTSECLMAYSPKLGQQAAALDLLHAENARRLMLTGRDLIFSIARARVSMPKSTAEYVLRCQRFAASRASLQSGVDAGGAALSVEAFSRALIS